MRPTRRRALFTLTLGVVLISAETKPRAAPGEAAASEWAIGMGAVRAEKLALELNL